MTVGISETESKYDVPAGVGLPRLEGLPRVARVRDEGSDRLEADYFDTGDLRLLRAGVTLRHRRGGADAGWHLKVPAGPGTRREIQVPDGRPGEARGGRPADGAAGAEGTAGGGGDVPQELARLVVVHTRGEPLRPVAHVATRRRRLVLADSSGASLAEVAEDDVSAQTLGESTAISRWREVEVELTGGGPRLLSAAGERLRAAGLRPAGRAAKLERALGREPARHPPQPEPGPSTPAGQVVLAYLRAQARALKALDPMVRGDEPDAVHQMRVTIRRLRSTLRSFGPCFDRSTTGALDAELQWLGRMLGRERDPEVLGRHLGEVLHQMPVEHVIGPVQARVQGHFAAARAAGHAEVLGALDSQRYFSLLDALDRLVAEPPFTTLADAPAREVLPAAVRRTYRRTRRRMRRAWREPAGPALDARLHHARKAARRARYAGEAVSPAFGRPAGRFTGRVKKLASVLGDHQDTVIARRVERELGMRAHLEGENAYSYGVLHEHDTQAAARLQERARAAWRRASRARYRRWMR